MASLARDIGLADGFLSAALEPHRWDDALRALARATGSRHAQLIGFGEAAVPFNWISDIDDSVVSRSAQIDFSKPDLNFRVEADRLPGRPDIVHEAHYDIARQALRADDYLDLCAEFDIFDGCQTRLMADDTTMIGLALLRDSRNGRTTQDQRDLFADAASYARMAVRMQRAVEAQGFALLTGTFEAMDRAIWLLDATGRVAGMTPRADLLLSTGRLRLADGQIATQRPDESRLIARAIRGLLDLSIVPVNPVTLADADGDIGIMLEFFPLPVKPWSLPFAPRAMVVARVSDPTDRYVQLLKSKFRLTPAEADIAVRIAAGASRTDVARARGVSGETLKVQLRSIYEKTGCSRESQLVRIVSLFSN